MCTTAGSWPLTLLRTLLPPEWFPFGLFIVFLSVLISLSPFKIWWHLILSHFTFVDALLDNVDLAFSISAVTDLWVTSVVAFSKGLRNFHYFLTLNFYHSAQALSVSLTVRRMRKVKHEKPLKSRHNIKGMVIQRCSFQMAIYKEWCKATLKSMKTANAS